MRASADRNALFPTKYLGSLLLDVGPTKYLMAIRPILDNTATAQLTVPRISFMPHATAHLNQQAPRTYVMGATLPWHTLTFGQSNITINELQGIQHQENGP